MDYIIILIISLLVSSILYYIYIYKKQIEKFENYEELPDNAKEELSKKIRGINTNSTTPQHDTTSSISTNTSNTNTIDTTDKSDLSKSTNDKSKPQSQTHNMDDYIPKSELKKYILKTELKSIKDVVDKSKYILKSEVKPCDLIDKNKYILKSEIKSSPDLDISKYVLKTDLQIPVNITDSLRNINQQIIKPDISIDEINNSKSIDKLSTCLNLNSSKQDSSTSKDEATKEEDSKIDEINNMNKKKNETIHINDIKVPENKINNIVFNMPIPKLNVVELPILNENTRKLSNSDNIDTVKKIENQFIFPSLGTLANPIQVTTLDYPKGCVKSRRVIANRDAFVAY